MIRTHAEFKMIREMVGCSQQHLADLMGGINVKSVKDWEKPDNLLAPDEAWRILAHMYNEFQTVVAETLRKVDALPEDAPITLRYYRDRRMFEQANPIQDPGEWQLVNARVREVAARLRAKGRIVNVLYPDE